MPRTQRQHDPRQQAIAFERASQRQLLKVARLSPYRCVDGSMVSGDKQLLALRAIDEYSRGHGVCWMQDDVLAAEAPMSRRTFVRAIQALRERSLLIVERRSIGSGRETRNHYRIVWNELELLRPREPISPADQCATVTDQCATVTDQCATVALSPESIETISTATNRRAREAAAAEIFSEGRQSMPAKRKQPVARPILEADYAAAPTEHRPTVRREVSASTAWSDGSEEKRFEDHRRGLPGWDADDQDRVRDMFAAAGVAKAYDLMRTAIARGKTPADCDAGVEQFHGSVEAKTRKPLGPGALVHWVEQGGWPCLLTAKADLDKPEAAPSPDLAELRKHAARRERNERLAAQAKAERERMQERDDRLGAILDALPEEKLVKLLQQVPRYWHEGVNRRYIVPRPIEFGMLRQDLFTLLENEGQRS